MKCGRSAYRLRTVTKAPALCWAMLWWDGRARFMSAILKHHCPGCDSYFNAGMEDLALSKSHYTHRVVHTAVRLVLEDGLPYRAASWRLWRDHRIFVPFATIQNWVEAGGKKSGRGHRR
jgi:hypothetical protein